ncbi:uncharacterized protein LOC142505808 isoform X2 [Primulina tabacum]|uniref:uncharacterized protein LOC142505808 isoform X2 n=1 Tax=Primulina tabacum TaxID=48773 RepID=UPI003F5AB2C8
MAEGHESQSSDQSSSRDSADKKTQVPTVGAIKSQNGNVPLFPIMYPSLVPGLFPPQQDQEQMNRGPGLYAVPVLPFMQPITGFPSNTLIPFTYNIPTLPETRGIGREQVQAVEQQQQEAGPQRQVVVRRFQIAIHIDVLLILKLAAVIFLFNQDGSKQRLTLLVFLASLVYLYQTGALAPVIRWLSQGMRRAAAPPQPPRAGVQADNIPAGEALGNENAGMAEEQLEGEDGNQRANDGNMGIENENAAEAGQGEVANRWWVIVKEIQMIVFGFITSLLPGFHNVD